MLLLILCITFYLYICFDIFLETSAYHERDTGVKLVILWKGEWKSPDLIEWKEYGNGCFDDFLDVKPKVVNHFHLVGFSLSLYMCSSM